VPPLKGKELSLLQKQVDAWIIIEEHHITKTFKFPDFR
jgi:4a-hydroxytetrahydrobiopterin dehydratase